MKDNPYIMETQIFTQVANFFGGDRDKVNKWLHAKNPMLGGVTPNSMMGSIATRRKLLQFVTNQWQEVLLSREPSRKILFGQTAKEGDVYVPLATRVKFSETAYPALVDKAPLGFTSVKSADLTSYSIPETEDNKKWYMGDMLTKDNEGNYVKMSSLEDDFDAVVATTDPLRIYLND